jgi:glycosyltransferase 2 family protein
MLVCLFDTASETSLRANGNGSPVRKRIIIASLKYGIGFGVLGWVLWRNRDGLQSVFQRHFVEGEPLHYIPLILATFIYSTSVLLTFVRWYILVRAQELPFTLANAMRLGLLGLFFSTFLPSSVGGDIPKAYFIARGQSRRTVAVATVMIDRAVGLWGLCLLVALLGTIFWTGGMLEAEAAQTLQSIVIGSIAICIVSAVVWILLGILPEWRAQRFAGRLTKIPKVGHSAAEFWRAIWMYRSKQISIVQALLLSLVGHVGFVLTFYFAALTVLAADQIPSLSSQFMIVPIGMAIQAGFPAPGGVGGGEYAFGALYSLVHYQEANGVLCALVQRVMTWAVALGGIVVYLCTRPRMPQTHEEECAITEEGMNHLAAEFATRGASRAVR